MTANELTANVDLLSTRYVSTSRNPKLTTIRTQSAYETAVLALFENLDRAEKHLATSPGPYYFGSKITEVDVRLYVTIARFDPVYLQHFKCNIRDIRSGYPALHKWLRKLYWGNSAFSSTTNFQHIKSHYMESHTMINPSVRYQSCL